MKTIHIKQAIDKHTASAYFEFLYTTIDWEDGIKNTRKGKPVELTDHKEIQHIVLSCIEKYNPIKNMALLGIYANLYRDGNDCAVSHRHVG